MNRTRVILASATAAFGLALVAACGTGSYGSAGNNGNYSSSPQSTQSAAPTTQAPAGVSLNATTVGKLGQVVTDANGMTLYRFDKDTAKPPVSNCNDACASLWPPVLAGNGQLTLNGVDKSVVGTVDRKDGSKQVTINGWPIYRYAKDTAAGDATGQGVGGTWFAVTPQGKKASGSPVTAAPSAPSTSSQSSSGYSYGY